MLESQDAAYYEAADMTYRLGLYYDISRDFASTAQIDSNPLPPAAVGTQLHFAYTLNNPFDFASNAVAVTVVP